MSNLKELETQLERAQKIYDREAQRVYADKSITSFEAVEKRLEPFVSKVAELSRQIRMIKPGTFDAIPEYGDVMSLKEFIETVNDGGFIDYDGSGNYVRDGKMSDISIYPSDVKHNAVRNDFDTIVWFNR